MNVATLPDYPSLKTPILGGPDAQGKFWNRRRRVVIDLIAVVAIAAILYEFRQLKRAIDRPWLDRDVRHVFELIPNRYDYQLLSTWCGLVESDATPTENAAIQNAIRTESDRRKHWCSPLAVDFVIAGIASSLPMPNRWIRLSSPSDSNQWIGIGIVEDHESIRISLPDDAFQLIGIGIPQHYESSKTNYWIVCRVPIGF
jgi:hypothetical protein